MQTNKYLRYAIFAGIFVIPFIPFIVANGLFFPFITGKNFIFRIVIEIITACWLILALRDKSYLPKTSWVARAFGTFLVVMLAATLLSENPYKSFWSNYERMEGYVTLLHLFAYFMVAGTMLASQKLWSRFFHASIFASIAISVFGFLQLAGVFRINQGGVRLDATFGNATYLAVYMLFHIFLTLLFLVRSRGDIHIRLLYGGAILMQLTTLYFTATRGAILGLMGGLLLTSILISIFEKERKVLRRTAFGILAALVLLVGGFVFFKDSALIKESPVLARISSISLADAAPRFMVWQMAWQGVKERPVFGWGQESFNFVFNKYYNPEMHGQEQWFDRTHNIVFDWLIAGGILGFLGYISLFAAALFYVWRKNGIFSATDKSLLTGMLAGYFFHNIFVFDNITSYLLFASVLAFVHSSYATSSKLVEKITRGSEEAKIHIAIPAIIIVACIIFYTVNVPALLTSRALIKGLSAQKEGPQENIKHLKRAIAYDSFGTTEAREQLVQVSAKATGLNIDQKIKQELLDLALTEMKKQTEWIPGDARFRLFLGALYVKAGRNDDALAQLQKGLELSPRKQSILFEIGSVYLNKGEIEKAVEYMKRAYDLAPEYYEARLIYALSSIYAKDFTLAESLLGGPKKLGDPRVMRAFYDVGNYKKAIEAGLRLVEEQPGDIQYRLQLAGSYLADNQRLRAVEVIQDAIEISPEFKSQGEAYIKQIREGRQ